MRNNPRKAFEIVLHPASDKAPIPLESVFDANQATVAFHKQFQRLTREGASGELVILNRHAQHGLLEGSPILRQPLR